MSYVVERHHGHRAHQSVATLWPQAFGPFPAERYRWIYQRNPAGEALVCVLATDSSRDPVGSTAMFPRNLWSHGQLVRGGISGDFMVVSGHRSVGPALMLQKRILEESGKAGIDLVYGFPNAKSDIIVRRLGYRAAPGFVSLSLPVRSERFFDKRVRNRGVRWFLSGLTNLALRLRPGYWRHVFDRLQDTEIVETFDRRFDELWLRISKRYALVGQKDSDFLNWRYSDCPGRQYRAFVVHGRDPTEIDGYVVFSSDGVVADIVDFACDANRLLAEKLLVRFGVGQRRAGIQIVSATVAASKDIFREFGRAKFRHHGETKPLMIYCHAGCPVNLETLETGIWYLVPGDND